MNWSEINGGGPVYAIYPGGDIYVGSRSAGETITPNYRTNEEKPIYGKKIK